MRGRVCGVGMMAVCGGHGHFLGVGALVRMDLWSVVCFPRGCSGCVGDTSLAGVLCFQIPWGACLLAWMCGGLVFSPWGACRDPCVPVVVFMLQNLPCSLVSHCCKSRDSLLVSLPCWCFSILPLVLDYHTFPLFFTRLTLALGQLLFVLDCPCASRASLNPT